jgi:hypothetical protein
MWPRDPFCWLERVCPVVQVLVTLGLCGIDYVVVNFCSVFS